MVDKILEEWKQYKTSVPTHGKINETISHYHTMGENHHFGGQKWINEFVFSRLFFMFFLGCIGSNNVN
jgi:hypothetical protein